MAEKKPRASSKKSPSDRKPLTPGAESGIPLWELKKEIDERAHEIYLERIATHAPGDDLSDWLQAEAQIKKKHKLS